MVVGRPAQPHVEYGKVHEAACHERVALLLGLITSLAHYIEGTEAAEDDCEGDVDGAPDKEVFLFFFEHFWKNLSKMKGRWSSLFFKELYLFL